MELKILITAFDYRPRLGGVATCAFEVARALSRQPGVTVRLIAASSGLPDRDLAFDSHGDFVTKRVKLPSRAFLAVPRLSVAIASEALAWRPDVTLSLLWMPDGVANWSALPARLATRAPHFLFSHGVEVLESRRTLKKRIRAKLSLFKKAVFRSSAAVFAVSQHTAELVESLCGVPKASIQVVNNGVNANEFKSGPRPLDLVQKYGLEGKTVFLTVSRLHDYKGIDKAIDALAIVREKHRKFSYLVCGEGPYADELKRQVDRLGLQDNVIFVGPVPFERLNDYYNLCDVFVLLSREDLVTPNIEGFGIVFLEAAACGKPSIAGRSGGIPDAVADGKTGWLVAPCDERAIADAMLKVIDEPKMAAEVGAAARERATKHFTWERAARQIVERMRHHVRQ